MLATTRCMTRLVGGSEIPMSKSEDIMDSASRAVAWWPVHEFMAALLAQANDLPLAGTPAWCSLSDGDPRKLLALAAAGSTTSSAWRWHRKPWPMRRKLLPLVLIGTRSRTL